MNLQLFFLLGYATQFSISSCVDKSSVLVDHYMPGFACLDNTVYSQLSGAESACCACDRCHGVVSFDEGFQIRAGPHVRSSTSDENTYFLDSANTDCSYSDPVTRSFLRGYACRNAKQYDTLEVAKIACCVCAECSGVAHRTDLNTFSIRSGNSLHYSPFVTEFTYLKDAPTNTCKIVIAGAGPGGVYSAWRLAMDDPSIANEICIFEKNKRVGGRLFNANCGNVPEMCDQNLVAELGAESWSEGFTITHSLIKDVFGLPFECYSRDDDDCNISLNYVEVRGEVLGPDEIGNSINWPYRLRPSETFNEAEGTYMPRIYSYPYEIFAPDFSDPNGLGSSDPATKWSAYEDLLAEVANFTEDGIGANELTAEMKFKREFSYELNKAAADSDFPHTLSHFASYNFYDFCRMLFRDDTMGMWTRYAMKYPYAYSTYVDRMIDDIVDLGGKLFLEHQVMDIQPVKDHKVEITVRDKLNDKEIVIDQIDITVLNLPRGALFNLGPESLIFRGASEMGKEALYSTYNSVALKLLFYYPDAWWKRHNETIKGDLDSDDQLGHLRWHAIPLTGDIDEGGLLLNSYLWGEINTIGIWNFDSDKEDENVLTILRRSNPLHSRLLDDLHFRMMEMVSNIYDTNGIPEPQWGLLSRWDTPIGASGVRGPSDVPPGMMTDSLLQPLEDTRIKLFITNTDFGPIFSEAESSLLMAERGLNRIGVSRPEFIEEHYYNSNIAAHN